jgi:hypothetical protein
VQRAFKAQYKSLKKNGASREEIDELKEAFKDAAAAWNQQPDT